MKIIKQSHKILNINDNILENIERIGRTCYQSKDKIKTKSAKAFVLKLIKNNHLAMLEFNDITVQFITNRGLTHELVRHRLCSFAQESTRYVKYDGRMEFIRPIWLDQASNEQYKLWLFSMDTSEKNYKKLLKSGWSAQQAREILPNSLKTEIIVKANLREWRHVLKLRCSKYAHPQIQSLMLGLLKELKRKVPLIFDDIK